MKLFLLLSLTYRHTHTHTLSLSPLQRCTYYWRWPWGFLPLGQACSAWSWGHPALVQVCAMGPETTNLTVWPPASQFDPQPHSLTTSRTVWPPASQFNHQLHSLPHKLISNCSLWFQWWSIQNTRQEYNAFTTGQNISMQENHEHTTRQKNHEHTTGTQPGRKTMNTQQEHRPVYPSFHLSVLWAEVVSNPRYLSVIVIVLIDTLNVWLL